MLDALAKRCRETLSESIVPFWMQHSIDHERGGFWSCLERDGTVFDQRKYVWMNGRQVWTLARLYRSFDPRPEWLEAARGGAEFLRKHVFDEHGRCWFSLTADGAPAGYQRKPYGAVFAMLGFLEYAKASGDAAYRELAVDLYQRIRGWLAEPALLGRPQLAGAPPLGNLADIYVLTAMTLDLAEEDPHNTEYEGVLRECLRDVQRHWEPRNRVLFENAPLSPAAAATPEGRLICPGSVFEINWLLFRALDHVPDAAVQALLLETLDGALEFGWDSEHGGFFYFLDSEGKPPLQLEWPLKLWWVHVEALYALVNAYERTRDSRWLVWLERVVDWVWQHFPDEHYGEWYGYLDRRGAPLLTLKGGSYKGCFHIPRALLFTLQAIERIAVRPSER